MTPQHRLMVESAGPVVRSISHDLYSTKTLGLAKTRWNGTHAALAPNFLDEFLIQQMHQCPGMMKIRHNDLPMTIEKLNEGVEHTSFGRHSGSPLTLLVGVRQWVELANHGSLTLIDCGPRQARMIGDVLVRQCSGLPVSSGIRSCFLYHREAFHYELSVHSEFEDNVLTVLNQFSWVDKIGAIRIQCKEF